MKIGILTYHRVVNSGSVMQAYCVQKILENLGENCQIEIIDYIPSLLLKKICRSYIKKKFSIAIGNLHHTKLLYSFVSNNCNLSSKIISDDLNRIKKKIKKNKYDTIVVDCWAPWCGPCRMIGPIIEELASELQGKIVFGKLNVDENQTTAMNYRIMSIPSLLVFKKGKHIDTIVGAIPKQQLQSKLETYI